MKTEDIKSEIHKLGVTDKLNLVEELWNDIATSNEVIPLYEWQIKELDRRLEAYKKGDLATVEWQSAHADLKNKYK